MADIVTDQGRDWITLRAPAKINLCLAVLGKRADGYHEIDSLMQKVALEDRIRVKRGGSGIRLTCPGTSLPTDERNLIFRAALAFLQATGLEGGRGAGGIDIVLEKKIPIAAGLGGGSSDAASVLHGMNLLFAAGLTHEELRELARPLGADVPFFVYGEPAAWATGIGEKLTAAMPLGDYHIVLVNPGFPVSTAWAYENLALTSDGNTFILARGRGTDGNRIGRRFSLPGGLHNDLEAVTIKRFPEIEFIKKKLQQDGAEGALMSGSGPTVFGLFTEYDSAGRSFTRFVEEFGDNVFMTKPFGQT